MALQRTNAPKRVVLRFRVQHEREEAAINKRFFELFGPKPDDDFFSHLMAPNESRYMHIVLDLFCKTNPKIDASEIAYEVFLVKKKSEELYGKSYLFKEIITEQQVSDFEKLDSNTCEIARERCERVNWGTDRSQSEELVGERALHGGHAPSTLVSRASRDSGKSLNSPL
jgi:hypothetical protein